MALPSSGPLSIDDIAVEFGGAAPHGLTEYYAADDNVPASGEIAITDFYGASNIPPPVPRQFFSRTSSNANTLGCKGTHGLLRGASARGNYSTTYTYQSNANTTYTGCQIVAASESSYMYYWNPAFYHRQHPAQYNISDTDRLCRIQFKFYAQYASGADTVGNPTHATYGKLSSTAGNTTLHSSSGSTAHAPLTTYTTTQNLQWYIDNNEYIQFSIYAVNGNTNNCKRTVGSGYATFDIDTIDFVI